MQIKFQPLFYHRAIADLLAEREPDLWAWFRSEDFGRKYRAETSTELLRTAVRLEATGANRRRYELATEARDRLGLRDPLCLYQMHDVTGIPNAYLVFTPGEIVICFAGRILELLDDEAELLYLLGHEIAHYKLFVTEAARYHAADRLLFWFLMRDGCPAEFVETWRRYRLYTEIYCDLGGLVASGNRDATIRGLVKSLADFRDADAASYLRQVAQLMAAEPGASRGMTHPELHVRVLAVAAASRDQLDDETVRALISGAPDLGALDLLDQVGLLTLTRSIAQRVLSFPECRSRELLALAENLFGHDDWPESPSLPLSGLSPATTKSVQTYLLAMLLDFGTVARQAEALATVARVADELGLGPEFRTMARQELKGRRHLLSGLRDRAA